MEEKCPFIHAGCWQEGHGAHDEDVAKLRAENEVLRRALEMVCKDVSILPPPSPDMGTIQDAADYLCELAQEEEKR